MQGEARTSVLIALLVPESKVALVFKGLPYLAQARPCGVLALFLAPFSVYPAVYWISDAAVFFPLIFFGIRQEALWGWSESHISLQLVLMLEESSV